MRFAGLLGPWLVVGVTAVGLAPFIASGARAQAVAPVPAESPAVVDSGQPAEGASVPGGNDLDSPAPGDAGASGIMPTVAASAPTGRSAANVIVASLFDDIYSEDAQNRWTPLAFRTFFTEGWDQPYVNPTAGSGGAPRQGWVNAFGGNFYRAWFFAYAFDQGINQRIGNGYLGRYEIFIPFNRRFELEIRDDFIVSNKGGPRDNYHNNTGDLGIIPRFQLSESKDFGQTLSFGVFAPTGRQVNGNGVAAIQPWYQFWWNFHGNWAMRGETGVTVPTNHATTSGYTTYHDLLAIGRYFPGSKDRLFQQWWFYLVATQNSTIAGSPRHETGVTLLPGIRCKIPELKVGTGLWYFFASVNVPVTGPGSFSYQPVFAVLYDY